MVNGPVPQPEWDRLAALQRSLRSLDGGGDVSGVTEAAGRGVRLRLTRLAVESLIRSEGDERARRRRDEFDRAVTGLMERVTLRAQTVASPRLALPAPAVPSAPPAPVPVRVKAPAPVKAAVPAPAPAKVPAAKPKKPASRRPRAPRVPPPEFWSPRLVLGFRMWDERGRLHGAFRAWDRPVYEARCVSGRGERDDGAVPHTDGRCGTPPCGIYVFKEPAQLLGAFGLPEGSRRFVLGLVALSGKVVEHERGFRGQKARVVAAAVVGQGLVVRVEGIERLQSLFAAPDATVTGLIATDPAVVEEVRDPLEMSDAIVSYLSLARDFCEVAGL